MALFRASQFGSGSLAPAHDLKRLNTALQQLTERIRFLERIQPETRKRGTNTAGSVTTVFLPTFAPTSPGGPPFDAGSTGTILVTLPFASSPYTATLDPILLTFYFASSSAGADFVFTLPAATGTGSIAIVKKMDANAHNIAIGPTGADTIDGVNSAANSTITIQYDALRIIDSGAGAFSIW
jgi:hypothetical protein